MLRMSQGPRRSPDRGTDDAENDCAYRGVLAGAGEDNRVALVISGVSNRCAKECANRETSARSSQTVAAVSATDLKAHDL